MSYSLNEVEATAKRAARGAGYSWGLAEEAGKATRWLCANGLDGCGALARLLDQVGADHLSDLSPQSTTGDWAGASDHLCPLTAGAALCDNATLLADRDIVMRNVLYPVLVLPFAAAAAKVGQRSVSVICDGQTVVCDASGECGASASEISAIPATATLQVTSGGAVGSPQARATRATPEVEDWATLSRFAQRTYAPASEASRLLGAGAGLSDND